MENNLGLKKITVKMEAYSSSWIKAYEKEKTLLLKVFKDRYIAIEHIGSTAIPNLKAKPIIDIAIKVSDCRNLDGLEIDLLLQGYREKSGIPIGNQRFFRKGSGGLNVFTHHLHVIENNDPAWDDKIGFRNFLRENSDMLNLYATVKQKLSKKFPNNRPMYAMYKRKLIDKIYPPKIDG